MAIVISGVNNNDKITAADGTIDLLSGVNYAGTVTAPGFTASNNITAASINVGNNIQVGNAGIITATTLIGNVTGNVNHTSNLLLQISGSEKLRIANSGAFGLNGTNYGTSGQVLQTGGSGANPSWTTMSSDVVKLTSGSITSSTSELVMDNLFSTTYRAYKFIFTDFTPATMNARISYQYRIGTTNQSGNDYYEGGLLYYYNGSESLTSGKEKAASNGRIGRWGTSNTALNASQFEITMSDPKSTRSVKQMFVLNSNPFETDQYYSFQAGFSQWRSSSAVDGIRWYCSTGNIAYLNYAVYGFKH